MEKIDSSPRPPPPKKEKNMDIFGKCRKCETSEKMDSFEKTSFFSISGFSPIAIVFTFFFWAGKNNSSYFWPRSLQISFFCNFRQTCPHHISLSPVSRHWSSKRSNLETQVFKNIIMTCSGLSQIFNYLYCKCFPCSLKEKQQSICSNSKVYDGGRVQQIINGYQKWIFVSKKWILRVLQVCQVSFFFGCCCGCGCGC